MQTEPQEGIKAQWCEEARRDFKLEREVDEQLAKRKFKAGVTQTYGEWRRIARQDPEGGLKSGAHPIGKRCAS